MPTEIKMPQLSDTMTEGTLVKWNVKEGDKVKAGQEIAEVETDKATMPMEAFASGTLAVILVKEGEKVAVGGSIGVIATGAEKASEIKATFGQGSAGAAGANGSSATVDARMAATTPTQNHGAGEMKDATDAHAASSDARSTSNRVGAGASAAGSSASRSSAHALSASASSSSTSSAGGHTAGGKFGSATIEEASSGEVHDLADTLHGATRETLVASDRSIRTGNGPSHRARVSPLARRIAEDKQIDLKLVTGSGPNGRIVQKDILSFKPPVATTTRASAGDAGKKKSAPAINLAPKIPAGEKQSIPHTKMRTVIASRLQQSKQTIPHFYETVDIDVTDLSKLREQMNKALEAEGIRLSIGDLIAKGITHALLIHPGLNAHWKDTEVVRFGDVHLGMAVALPEGLIVPVLRSVNTLSLREIRTKSADLVDRARKQNLKQNELSGATFTVSNLGTFGIREFSAIINPPEVGILAIGSAEERAVVRAGQITIRTMMTVTLSADHRAVDGASAADFLKTLKALLEEPGMMLVA